MPAVVFNMKGNASSFKSAARQTQSSTRAMKTQFRSLGSRLLSLGKKLSTLQTNMLGLRALKGIAAGFKRAITDFASFESGMLRIQAVMQLTAKETNPLKNLIVKLGKETQFSVKDVQKSVYDLATMGRDAPGIVNLMKHVSRLAVATDIELTPAANILNKTLSVFGKKASEAGKVTDLLTNMFISSSFNIEKWAVAMPYAGTLAKGFGKDLGDVVPLLMALSDAGMPAEMAATGLAMSFQKLLAPSGKMKGVLKRLGLTVKDVDVRTHGFIGTLRNLKKAKMDAKDAAMMFGRQSKVITGLLNAYNETLGKKGIPLLTLYEKKLKQTGTAGKVAAGKQKGLSFSFAQVSASIDIFSSSVGKALSDSIGFESLVLKLNTGLGILTNLVENLDFGALKDAGAKMFDPQAIIHNLDAAFSDYLPKAADYFGSQLVSGAIDMLQFLNTNFPAIFEVGGKLLISAITGAGGLLANLFIEGMRSNLNMVVEILTGLMSQLGALLMRIRGFEKIGESLVFSAQSMKMSIGNWSIKMADKLKKNTDLIFTAGDYYGKKFVETQRKKLEESGTITQIHKQLERYRTSSGVSQDALKLKGERLSRAGERLWTPGQKEGASNLMAEIRSASAQGKMQSPVKPPQSLLEKWIPLKPADERKTQGQLVINNQGQIHHNYRAQNRDKQIASNVQRTPKGTRTEGL